MGSMTASAILVALTLLFPAAHASASTRPSEQRLSEKERSVLRHRLENIWNEVHLMVRNENSAKIDFDRLQREMRQFRVLERIPLRDNLDGLKEELELSIRSHGLGLTSFKVIGRSRSADVPPELFTDSGRFRLSEKQLVEETRIEIRGKGKIDQVYRWISDWKEDLLRVIEPVKSPEQRAGETWRLQIRAYRFRDIQFPRLKPRDPMQLLPNWARKNPDRFAEQERLLWSLVVKTREMIPKSESAYQMRGKFLLEGARMSFFIKKTENG